MKTILIILLILVALLMIYLGIKAAILPPILTGVGFIIIAILFKIGVKR
ncbi:hypothetical protein ACFS6I_08810 [Sphingobacterium anhuiense]|uniref:Uncharacterized protein n=1 Tax=Sphingobacterium anhuiense TaxID=493780 RepID=A0ABW5YUG4_9SPHI